MQIHFTFTITVYSTFSRFAAGKSDKEILDNLLKNSRYDKRLLPPVDGKSYFYTLFYVFTAKFLNYVVILNII